MRPIAFSVALILGAFVTAAVEPTSATNARAHTVTCDKIILTVESGRSGGYRIVLGTISVPRAHIPQTVPTRSRPWRYWSKAGLVVRGGGRKPVDVIVPKAWRDRVAITWGNSGIVSSLRIAPCPAYAANERWNAYAGGFLLRERTACVPLLFRTGRRSAIVRFGVGRRCP